MKVAIITCHDVYNYGASLQAYALMHYLKSQGHETRIIDYKPDYLSHHYEFGYVNENNRYFGICKRSIIFKFLYGLRLLPITFATWRRIKPFNKFTSGKLSLTQRYNSYEELVKNPPEADVYVAGSDQIWNCNLPNGKDPAFYLAFGNPNKKMSYAASFAMKGMPIEYVDLVRGYLSYLDDISVRETSGLGILKDLGYSGTAVMDPVYLLTKDQWEIFSGDKPIIRDEYVLVYNLNHSNEKAIKNVAFKLKQTYNCRVVAIDSEFKCRFSDQNVHDAGPVEFVNLIKNAKYIVTDSFHGMSFSIILERPFCVMHAHSDSSRISDMLKDVSAIDCLNNTVLNFAGKWDDIRKRIECKRGESISFLEKNIKP